MYTADTALVYDLFPRTISPEFENPYTGRDHEVTRYVLVAPDDRYIFMEGAPAPGMEYYGRALVGDGEGEYGEFNAYTLGTAQIVIPDENHLVDITRSDDQLEFEFDDIFRRVEEEHRLNQILDEAAEEEDEEVEGWDRCQGCDCEGECPYFSDEERDQAVAGAVYETRTLLRELEQVLEYHVDKKNGDANALLVPTISEAAADHLYNRISNLHDRLAWSLNQ